jgi:spoIIIJ-associated protein
MDRDRRIAEVELSRRTVDEAVTDGLKELGLSSRDQVEIEVVNEGKPGFMGLGREMAVVVMRPKPESGTGKKRTRSRRRRRGGDHGDAETPSQGNPPAPPREKGRTGAGEQRRDRAEGESRRPARERPSQRSGSDREASAMDDEATTADIATQAGVATEFLEGLLAAFGLEGAVANRIEEDVLYLDVSGDQTEALVGPRGSIMDAVLELTRTVVQRKTFGAPRMRLDIGGYTERRREALRIYAGKLAEKVLEEQGEVMLEPMNAADRKVVHDTIAGIDGVRSFSEGEDPNRAVVVAPDEA